jgi:hypothetical protein
MAVASFYVPYYSEETDERKDVLFMLGKEYTLDGNLKMPSIKDSKGNEMEIDVNQKTYFSFIKK